MTKCAVCGRTLKSAKSIAAGVGPECGQGRRGRRHKGPQGSLSSGGGGYSNGANGHGGVMTPPATGEPLSRDEALAAIKRVAEGGIG